MERSPDPDAKYQQIIATLPQIIWMADPAGNLVFLNDYGSAYFGKTTVAAAGLQWATLSHPADQAAVVAAWQNAAASGRLTITHRLRRSDGVYRWHLTEGAPQYDPYGAISSWVGASTDIDALTLSETEAEGREYTPTEARAILEMLRARAPVRLIFLDHEFRYVYINQAAAILGGITPEEHIGRRAADVIPELWPQLEPMYRHVLATGESVVDVHIVEDAGAEPDAMRHILASHYPLESAGERIGIGVVAIDISEQKRLELQVQRAQRLETVGRLAGGIAHDFNNLLTVINGYTALLETDASDTDLQREALSAIQQAGEQATRLTRQLLVFSRRQVLAPEAVNLSRIVQHSEQLLRRLLGEDIALTTATPALHERVLADPSQLEQVLLNLVINARDAMPHGGQLDIAVRSSRLAEPRPGHNETIPAGRYVVLTVRDTGCGMDAATQAHIFEPFFTTKPPETGTGLGLATVYGIVKQSNGYIEVHSAPQSGTVFMIYLPALPDRNKNHTNGHAPAPEAGNGETILLVEDDAGVRAFMRSVLQRQGYRLFEAGDGATALQIASRYGQTLHLLVADVVLPQLSGHELAIQLRRRHPGLPVLFVSGYPEEALHRHGIATDAAPFLSKPFTPDALAYRVRASIAARGLT